MRAKNIFLGEGSSCLHYYAYHKMLSAKMVFVRFWGQSKNLEAPDRSPPVGSRGRAPVGGLGVKPSETEKHDINFALRKSHS